MLLSFFVVADNRLKYAYNIWRCPTPVNVSYYFLFDEKVQGPERPDVSQSLVASLCIKGAYALHCCPGFHARFTEPTAIFVVRCLWDVHRRAGLQGRA